jgi:cell division septation protein DedD
MNDDGFHEIQLNGKQLVFLFMAATVVSVVIFLCGVMVGRGVRTQQTAVVPDVDMSGNPTASPEAPARAPLPEASAPPPAVPDQSPEDDINERLRGAEPREDLSSSGDPARAGTPPPAPPPAESQPEASAPADRNAAASGGYTVQLAALRDRKDADAIVERLAGKGYPAYVQNPLPGAPPIYRVQVGRYQTRGEAEKVAARLRSEERFKPWITR